MPLTVTLADSDTPTAVLYARVLEQGLVARESVQVLLRSFGSLRGMPRGKQPEPQGVVSVLEFFAHCICNKASPTEEERQRGRCHPRVLMDVFFFSVLDLPPKTTPRAPGGKKTWAGAPSERVSPAQAPQRDRTFLPRSCRPLPVTAGLTTRPVCPQAPPGIAPPTHRTYIGFRIQ